jgi:hypothetical protein
LIEMIVRWGGEVTDDYKEIDEEFDTFEEF